MINNKISNKGKKVFAVLLMIALLFSSMYTFVSAADIVENGSFASEVESSLGIVNWETHFNTGFDRAFTSARGNGNEDHVQLDGNKVTFYGYQTGWKSDYIYYPETDSTEKTFKFGMDYGLYSGAGGDVLLPQKWHSLLSLGFMVNCTKNTDGTISGFYFALEGYDARFVPGGGPNELVVRKLDHMNFDDLKENSRKIVLEAEPIFRVEAELQANQFEIKSSNTKFDVLQNGEVIFSFDLATAQAEDIPASDYTGGNDFGFYSGYVGANLLQYDGDKRTGGHDCGELSVAEFTNVEIITRTVLPQSSVDVEFIDYTTKDDKMPKEIDETYNKEGFVGQTYTVNPVAEIGNYILVESPEVLNGKYIDGTVPQVKLYYVHPQYTVKYVDESGKELLDSKSVNSGLNLDTYAEKSVNIEGYKLTGESEQKVTLTKDKPNQTLTFVYTAEKTTIEPPKTTTEAPKNTTETPQPVVTAAATPTASPKTGDGFNLTLLAGAFLLSILGVGVSIWHSKKATAKK